MAGVEGTCHPHVILALNLDAWFCRPSCSSPWASAAAKKGIVPLSSKGQSTFSQPDASVIVPSADWNELFRKMPRLFDGYPGGG